MLSCSAGRMHLSCRRVYFVMVSFYISVLPFTECTAFEEVNLLGNQKNINNKVYQFKSLCNFLAHVHLLLLSKCWCICRHPYIIDFEPKINFGKKFLHIRGNRSSFKYTKTVQAVNNYDNPPLSLSFIFLCTFIG